MLKQEVLDKLIINPYSKKCFIFDLDGTIIFNNKMLSQANEALLDQIMACGHEVIFATGRSYRDFKAVMPPKFHNHNVTLFSGSLSRTHDGQIIRSETLLRQNVEDIVGICMEHKNPFIIDNVSHYYYPPFPGATFGFIDTQLKDYQLIDLAKMLETRIYKILIFEMQLYKTFREYTKENDLGLKHHSYDRCFDIVVNGCNKYSGVLPFIHKYHESDIYIFVNDYNDYELLSNFPNSILLGSILELQNMAKINLRYDSSLEINFSSLINVILSPNF